MTQQYVMTNSNLKGQVHSPIVNSMDEAIKYFQKNFPIEFIGCNIKQTKGINPQWGANFMANANWATEEQYNAFVAKYKTKPNWEVFSVDQMAEMQLAEMEREERKNRY